MGTIHTSYGHGISNSNKTKHKTSIIKIILWHKNNHFNGCFFYQILLERYKVQPDNNKKQSGTRDVLSVLISYAVIVVHGVGVFRRLKNINYPNNDTKREQSIQMESLWSAIKFKRDEKKSIQIN